MCDHQEPSVAVGEKHVGLAVWSSHLMPELYLLGSGVYIVLVFSEVREAMGERRGTKWGLLSPFIRIYLLN